MGRIKFTVHPLFVIFGLYFAAKGKVFSFLIFTISALIHELGHAITADRLGYRLKRVVLMPYGAVIKGDNVEMDYRDEIKIALSGPLLSLMIAGLFVSLWWLVPTAYPYTELVVVANLSLAAVNLLPAYPLDGGRVVTAAASMWLGRKKARRISRILGIILAAAVICLFIYSIFTAINLSILFFGLFILFGNVFVSRDAEYVRIASFINFAPLKKPLFIRHVAADEDVTVRDVLLLRRDGELLSVTVYTKEGTPLCTLPPERLTYLLQKGGLNERIVDVDKDKNCR